MTQNKILDSYTRNELIKKLRGWKTPVYGVAGTVRKMNPVWFWILIILLVILLILLSVEIAFIADFFRFRYSGQDGLLMTEVQRHHGIFGWFF
ncbi:hypothetical protein [Mycoplasmopsis sturni]|uniref:hypothetical protein n=1 Tax=Mycoplasmopsis sturni TaxID=39047 RepID=UPI000566FD62|nr:hypothetical protein [Mycoplasmopsis sturni]